MRTTATKSPKNQIWFKVIFSIAGLTLYLFLINTNWISDLWKIFLSATLLLLILVFWGPQIRSIDENKSWLENSSRLLSFAQALIVVAFAFFLFFSTHLQLRDIVVLFKGYYTVNINGKVVDGENEQISIEGITVEIWLPDDTMKPITSKKGGLIVGELKVPKEYIEEEIIVRFPDYLGYKASSTKSFVKDDKMTINGFLYK